MHYGWPSNAVPLLTNGTYRFTLTKTEASWLVSMTFIGDAIGSLLAVASVKPLGRKRLILLSSPTLAISWLLLALGPSQAYFFVGRLLGGTVDGMVFSIVPPYLNEIADVEIRGFMGAINMCSFAFGMAAINWLALFSTLDTVGYLAAGGALSVLLMVPFLPESPQYSLWTNDVAGARSSLRKLRGKTDVEEELNEIVAGISVDGRGNKLVDILFRKRLRRCLLVLFVLNWTTNLSGAGAIQAYSKTMFDKGNFMSASSANAVYYAVFCVSSMFSPLVVDRFGRKQLLVASAGLAIVPLLGNGVFLLVKSWQVDTSRVDFLEFVFILLFTVTHSMALYTLPVAIVAEIFPSDLKTVAMCILNVSFGVISTGVVLLFNWTYYSYGGYVPFFIFGGCLTVGLVFIILIVPDTGKNRLQEQHSQWNDEESVSR
ncbi:unnamed protein product [Phaedon cochleariae]|uniref:Major facilitator superfamily (MFS) profile domain-containing protein n=1 Tax=Phaedon cochleariae TaxID=80249 RepID=A0A9N9X4R5_PHACE|nr:unnamed protein product [Phaedon cochleariae]